MKSLVAVLLIGLLLSAACKKVVEDVKKDAAMDIITTGTWFVKSYLESDTELATSFTGYQFKFLENGKVEALKETLIVDGTWYGDIVNYSIVSEFPGAADPLKKLNGTWKLKDSGEEFVVAEMPTAQGTARLRLEKSP